MQIVTTVRETQQACRNLKRRGTLGLVPTMGALHDGHLSLVRRAQEECDAIVATIFVNPTQFLAGEGYETYPRTFHEDCAKLEAAGVDLLFAPEAGEMYLPGSTTVVEVADVGNRLDGASRPGHFRGVATVVAKLFHIVGPDRGYFGQKDAAQIAVLRAMIRDLNFPVELVACPIVREQDGLAMSSRNRHLSAEERRVAPSIYRTLLRAQALVAAGVFDPGQVSREVVSEMERQGLRVEYLEIVDPHSIQPVERIVHTVLVATAVWLGSTRLIDNVVCTPAS